MTEKELFDNLRGLLAFDTCGPDFGFKDEQVRGQVKQTLKEMGEKEFFQTISRFVRESYLTEENLELGYSIEDVFEFARWMSEYMDIDML